MKKKLINFIKNELTEVEEYVNVVSNEQRKDCFMRKNISVILATFVACILSVVVCGLSDNVERTNLSNAVQTPSNNDNSEDVSISVLPNDHLYTSAGAMDVITNTVVVNTEEIDNKVDAEDIGTDKVGDTNSEEMEIVEIETPNIDSSVLPEDSSQIDFSQVETENGYYCVWGDFYLTQKEFELVCRTVFCETGSSAEPFESKVMVATVIFNQLLDNDPYDKFPNTIKGVVYFKNGGNFSVVLRNDFKKVRWTDEIEEAVKTALVKNPYPRDMLYFRNKHYHTFGVPYKKSGSTYFSTRN